MDPISPLEEEIRALIVESLALEDVVGTDIDPAAPLFGEGLGLDSIDALELAMAISRRYGVEFGEDAEANRRVFGSVRSLAAFVAAHAK